MSAPNDTALPPLKPWTEADSRAALQGIGDRTSTGDLVITIEQREDQLCDALQALAEAEKERDQAMELAAHSERWRKAYQEGKHLLYAMGGEVADAAFRHLPCNEGPLDRVSQRILVEPFAAPIRKRAEAAEAKLAELENLSKDLRDTLVRVFPSEDDGSLSDELVADTRAVLERANAVHPLKSRAQVCG